MSSLIEQIRERAVKNLLDSASFGNNWSKRSKFLEDVLRSSASIDKHTIVGLGNHLAETFSLVGAGNRSQGSVSSAGTVWENLLVWYLNFCLAGTKAVCIKGLALCPDPIKNALTVQHQGVVVRSEPDILVISSDKLHSSPPEKSWTAVERKFEEIVKDLGSVSIINIQSKTNWKDCAQIPMLWNMLYNQCYSGVGQQSGFGIGTGGYSLSSLQYFGYAFATVPTGEDAPDDFGVSTLAVLRVKSLSAGYYWGYPDKQSVCLNISQIFDHMHRQRDPKKGASFPDITEIGKYMAEAICNGNSQFINKDKLLSPI